MKISCRLLLSSEVFLKAPCSFSFSLFSSIHICVTYLNTQAGVADLFVKDVRECTAEILKDSSVKTSGMVRFYFFTFFLLSRFAKRR